MSCTYQFDVEMLINNYVVLTVERPPTSINSINAFRVLIESVFSLKLLNCIMNKITANVISYNNGHLRIKYGNRSNVYKSFKFQKYVKNYSHTYSSLITLQRRHLPVWVFKYA